MKQTKAFSADVTVRDGEREVSAYISTAAVDRDGEVLVPQGMNSKDFEKNPVVFLGHTYYTLPVGQVVSLKRDDKGIMAKVKFATRPESHPYDQEWMPDTLLALFQQKVLRGFSVGFLPKESRPATDRDVEVYGAGCRRVISKWTLLELSVAPLPCNQEAVALAVSKGMCSAAAAKGVWGVDENTPVAEEPDETGRNRTAAKHVVQVVEATEPAPEPVGKRVIVAPVTLAEPEGPAVVVKRVHRILHTPAPDPAVRVKKLVRATVAKQCGRLYLD